MHRGRSDRTRVVHGVGTGLEAEIFKGGMGLLACQKLYHAPPAFGSPDTEVSQLPSESIFGRRCP